MDSRASRFRFAVIVGVGLVSAIASTWVLGDLALTLAAVLVGAAAGMGFHLQERRNRLDRLAAEVEQVAGIAAGPAGRRGMPWSHSAEARLQAGVEAIAARLRDFEHRVEQRHRVTGLPTREPLIERMTADGRGQLGVLKIMDYDRLCAFDTQLGDRLLRAMVERLQRMLPASWFLAHVDRSCLAIWFEGDPAGGEMDAIGYALGEVFVDGEQHIIPELRLGQAAMPAQGGDAQALLSHSLAALAESPASAGHLATEVQTGPGHVLAAARDRYALEQDLRQALSRGELVLRFQPLIDAIEGRVFGAEALARWFHPEHGQVSPAQFIPMAESLGLMHEIGMWTLNTALREVRSWRNQGAAHLRVAVNVSGHQLDRDDMAALIARTLARHSLGPDALEIELTESVAMAGNGKAEELFESLRATGVRIAIDDFGTGFSSLSTLRSLGFDKIKIDREFVTDVDTRRDSQAICQSIIALGRGLGIRVLAEGVERYEEYTWLRRHGCSYFQGFYFARPLTSDEFLAFTRDTPALAGQLEIGASALQTQIAERLTA
jgi:Amt family ammonium transporter